MQNQKDKKSITEYLNTSIGNTPIFENVYLFDSLNTIYFGVPKCANSTIRYLLYCNSESDFHTNFKNSRLKLYEMNYEKVSKTVELTDKYCGHYFLFTFVRNPYERILSAWKNKILKPSHFASADKRYIDKLNRLNNDPALEPFTSLDISYIDFVQHICKQENHYQDRHWASMYDLLRPDIVNYDFIGNLDKYDEHINFVSKKLKLKNVVENHINKSKTLNPRGCDSEEIKDLIYNKYKNDFIYFGYSK